MNLEHLLLWLSAKVQGSWSQFRGAVEELCTEQDCDLLETDNGEHRPTSGSDLPVYQRVRFALQHLGHAEFFSNQISQDWRVVPPTLALLPGSGEGVLCGARSPDLLRRLSTHFDVSRTAAPGMPDRIMIRGTSNAVVHDTSLVDLHIQVDAPTAILSALPDVRDPAAWSPMPTPETPGWTVHRFSPSRLAWVQSAAIEAQNAQTGLFRFAMDHQRFHYLRWRGGSYRVPVQVGKYATIQKRRRLLTYNESTLSLFIAAACRPPLLIERALVLCSGLLPSFDAPSRRLVYTNVFPGVAHLAAQLLRQEIER